MIIINSREFRDNQKKYFELALKQQVIVQQGRKHAFAITPISEDDQYFMDPNVKSEILEGIAQHKAGKTTRVDPQDFDKLLGL